MAKRKTLIQREDTGKWSMFTGLDNGKPFHIARDVDAVYSARHFRYFAGWPNPYQWSVYTIIMKNQ